MSLDPILDFLEQRGLQLLLAAILAVLTLFFPRRSHPRDLSMIEVCRSLYAGAATPADTARIDAAHAAVQPRNNVQVTTKATCGDLRRMHRLR